MKINQIVGEHKKGFKAKKYAQKPKQYIEPVKPAKPAAAPKPVDEARMSAPEKLQRAWEREQSKSTASRQRADKAKAEFEKEWKAKQEKEKQGVAEADELRSRGGIEAVNKKPRPGQTDFRDIPAGNYPGSQRRFSDKDREEQPDRLKAKIKSALGKHTRPDLPEQSVTEGSAHGYNVTRFYRKFKNPSKITAWLKKEAGLPKETKLYFDDADLVLGSDTIVPYALVDDTLKFNDLLTALVQATGGTSKEKVDGVYRDREVSEAAKITKSDTTGVEITADDGVKTTLPPEKAAALTPDPSNPNEYDLNPAATSPTGDTPAGPKVGANVEIKTAEAMSDDLSTMPTTEFVKGIYAAAAENGMDAPDVEAVKKQMVLTANGEVDVMATMQKAAQAFQSPEFKQMLADLEALIKQGESQPTANPELARIQELAGVPQDSPSSSTVSAPPEVLKQIGPQLKKKGIPNLTPVKPPAMPTGQLQSGETLTPNPDGTISYASGQGTYTYDKAGKPLKYTSPNFAGITQTNDLVSGNIAVRYAVGPLDMTFNFDKAGKSLDSEKIQYDLGMGVLGMAKDGKGITTRTWQDRGEDAFAGKALVKDPATYDRAMAQVNRGQAGAFDPNIDDGGTAYRPGEKEWAEKAAAQGNIDNLAKFNAAADKAIGKKPTSESMFKEELEAMLRIAKLR